MLHIVSCVPSLSQLSAIQNRWIIGTCLEQLGFRVWGLRNSREEGVGRFGSGVVRTMVQPPEKASRAAASPVEAPFVPEAASAAERAAGWKNPPSRMQLMLWSGSKRHVFVGMLGVSVLATIPWLLLTSGKKHDSHADYMDRAEGARRSRLSTASAAVAPPTSS